MGHYNPGTKEQLADWLAIFFYGKDRTSDIVRDYRIPRELADALLRDGWVTHERKLRFELRVVPLDERDGGKYAVWDTAMGDRVALFAKVWDAVAYVNQLNSNGRPNEKASYAVSQDVPTGSSGVAGEF